MNFSRYGLFASFWAGLALSLVGCASKKSEVAEEVEPPPPAAYPTSPAPYGGTAQAQGAEGAYPPPAGSQMTAPAPFQLREGEQLVTHMIESGESLSSIATKYNTSISRIQSANGMTGTLIYAGKPLQIPTSAPPQVAMNHGGTPTTTPNYGPAPPAAGGYAPPATAPTGVYPGTVYPGTAAPDPAATSYPRTGTPSSQTPTFPTPTF